MNHLLNNSERERLKPAIDELIRLCPEMMSRKIIEANVQQGFVFDTVRKLVAENPSIITVDGCAKNVNLLSVGCFEDTAFEGLKKIGYNITGIDPAVNCDLNTFFADSSPEAFDFIISTSVIEHVSNDEEFIDNICKLLKKGGFAVLTCDFKDSWKQGDPMPGEDQRLYTTYDLMVRLNDILINNQCTMVGPIDYTGKPDFNYCGHEYSFASYVFKKLW